MVKKSTGIVRASVALALASACAAGFVAGCDDSPLAEPALAPPRAAVVETGARAIRREVFEIEGSLPIANPVGGASTPPEQNRLRVARFRLDGDTPTDAASLEAGYAAKAKAEAARQGAGTPGSA